MHFNSRPRVGAGTFGNAIWAVEDSISIHAPVWGRASSAGKRRGKEDISIHAPVWGRAIVAVMVSSSRLISIHAPVWGRASRSLGAHPAAVISIHAPVWGRACCGRGHRVRPCRISIHAPVWGRAANLHKCKVLFMCKMVETRDRINGKRWIISKLVQYTAGGFVLLEQKHPGRYCANLPAYFVLPRSAQQPAYRRIGSPVCTRPVRPMVSMRV